MMYYPKYDIIYWDIFKNGTNTFRDFLQPYFGYSEGGIGIIAEKNFTIVRNPYDRLVSQFYHYINQYEFDKKDSQYYIKEFKKWVILQYGNDGYKGEDGHYFPQTKLCNWKNVKNMKVFHLEKLKYHEILWFFNLSDDEIVDIDKFGNECREKYKKSGHHAFGNRKYLNWIYYFDKETIKICNNYFLEDFINFEYEMIDNNKFVKAMRNII